jgi:hypothetical protein
MKNAMAGYECVPVFEIGGNHGIRAVSGSCFPDFLLLPLKPPSFLRALPLRLTTPTRLEVFV